MENSEHEALVWFGGEVKALDDKGKIGGFLVLYSTSEDPDLAKDFFDNTTDFGPSNSSPVKYHHGQDPTIGKKSLGIGALEAKDAGVWIEAQLEIRDEYEQAIFEMAKAGKLGWSSGTAAHLVEREQVGKAWHIKSWPLGLDASLTPTPCEPRTRAIPLKSVGAIPALFTAEQQPAETDEAETERKTVVLPVDDESKAVNLNITVKMDNQTDTGAENVKVQATSATAPQEVKATQNLVISLDDYNALQAKAHTASQPVVKAQFDTTGAPAFNSKTKPGDSFTKAYAYWVRTGDMGAVRSITVANQDTGNEWGDARKATEMVSIKASNAVDMEGGVDAEGGYAIPTGHFGQIIARRDESNVAAQLGVRNIPGKGTTVNVPLDGEADGEFVSTAEEAANDLDAPVLGQKAMTLVKYTKRVSLSDELMMDEDSQLMSFLADFVGRGMAKTHNSLLVTEAAANGTSIKTFASATTIAAGELQDMYYNSDLEPYLDDTNSTGWLTRRSTHGVIAKLQGTDFLYDASPAGSGMGRSILGVPVSYSEKCAALTTGLKPIFLANWFFMGVRNDPEFRVLRDPYSEAATGQLNLHYFFRTVYGVLQAEAIGYGTLA